jgi:hypothetical protein
MVSAYGNTFAVASSVQFPMTNPKLTISIDPQTGKVSVDGPIGDKLLFFGLLELAKEAISNHAREQAANVLLADMRSMPKVSPIKS